MYRAEGKERKTFLTKLLFDYFLSKFRAYLDTVACIHCKLLTVPVK